MDGALGCLPFTFSLLQAEGLQTPSLGWHSPLEIGETSIHPNHPSLGVSLKGSNFQTFRMCNLFIKTKNSKFSEKTTRVFPMIWLKPYLLVHPNMVFFKIHKGFLHWALRHHLHRIKESRVSRSLDESNFRHATGFQPPFAARCGKTLVRA